MLNSSVLGVIPARLASSRLPQKPLHPILGRPLLEWVWRRVSRMTLFDRVVIATDAPEIRELCAALGAPCVMTRPDHPSGTDRVAEVADAAPFRDFAVIVNVQGDEPLVEESHLESAVALVRDHEWELGTCAAPVGDSQAWTDPSVVKVVRGVDGGALYFSRAPIPFCRDGRPGAEALAAAPFLRHLGIYAYRREALRRWVALEPSPLERLERLEQLRVLESGMRMGVALVPVASPGVDTPADVLRMEELLSQASPHSEGPLNMKKST